MYRICGIPSFVMLYYYLYKLKINGPGKILFGAGKSLKSPWFLCLVSCTNPVIMNLWKKNGVTLLGVLCVEATVKWIYTGWDSQHDSKTLKKTQRGRSADQIWDFKIHYVLHVHRHKTTVLSAIESVQKIVCTQKRTWRDLICFQSHGRTNEIWLRFIPYHL